MPTINQLPLLSPVTSGDQFPVYSPANGDARRTSVASLMEYFLSNFASPTMDVHRYSPVDGFNILVPSVVSEQQWMLLEPAGALATGTITLPLSSTVPDGTEVTITTTQTIATLTIAPNGATIHGAVTSLAGGAGTILRYYKASNSWYNSGPKTEYDADVEAWLNDPTSAKLQAAVTDETGTGALVFATSPTINTPTINSATLTAPALGTPVSGDLTNCTGLPVAGGGTGAASLAAENVILGNGTSAVKTVAPSTAGNVLMSDGTTWASTAPVFASQAENIAGSVENKAVDPLGIREAFNCTGSAPVYACRAWVNFNGTGTVAIRASGNVSSITDNGVDSFRINFTTAMPDAAYAVSMYATRDSTINQTQWASGMFPSFVPESTNLRLVSMCSPGNSASDPYTATISVFR